MGARRVALSLFFYSTREPRGSDRFENKGQANRCLPAKSLKVQKIHWHPWQIILRIRSDSGRNGLEWILRTRVDTA